LQNAVYPIVLVGYAGWSKRRLFLVVLFFGGVFAHSFSCFAGDDVIEFSRLIGATHSPRNKNEREGVEEPPSRDSAIANLDRPTSDLRLLGGQPYRIDQRPDDDDDAAVLVDARDGHASGRGDSYRLVVPATIGRDSSAVVVSKNIDITIKYDLVQRRRKGLVATHWQRRPTK
jgi:hypothetical protein